MHVLDLTTLYIDGGEGGVNTYLREKASFLRRADGIRHTIIVPGTSDRTDRLEGAALHVLRSPTVPGNKQHRLLIRLGRVVRLIESLKPDVVEVDCGYFLAHVARRATAGRSVPVIGVYHAHLPELYTRAVRSRIRRTLTRTTEGLAWRYTSFCTGPCHKVLVTSRDLLKRLQGRRLPSLEYLPLGVNLELFQPGLRADRDAIPRVSDEEQDRGQVVLYVGRLSAEKNLDTLFESHRTLRRQYGTRLVIAGDGPLRGFVERAAARDAGITYLGVCPYGERLAHLYQQAAVLAAPSPNETFGLIILEAFASGVPVVTANSGGAAELLPSSGYRLARPGDSAHLAEQIGAAIVAGRHRGDVSEAHAYIESRYSWRRTFERLLSIYGQTCAQIAAHRASRAARHWVRRPPTEKTRV